MSEEKRRINAGDSVRLYWNDNTVVVGIVEARPCEGDELWYIRKNDGVVMAVNTRSSNFDVMYREHMEPTK